MLREAQQLHAEAHAEKVTELTGGVTQLEEALKAKSACGRGLVGWLVYSAANPAMEV